jgi:hypothetical protein
VGAPSPHFQEAKTRGKVKEYKRKDLYPKLPSDSSGSGMLRSLFFVLLLAFESHESIFVFKQKRRTSIQLGREDI